ncbi:MAG: hypothetical protein HY536_01205 [Candidatus Colwellbacteria bacterium]|nr:hypothetical protein [Candidatus Colwellbacteria bacterium]
MRRGYAVGCVRRRFVEPLASSYTERVLFPHFLLAAAHGRVRGFFEHWYVCAFRFAYSLAYKTVFWLDDRLALLASAARFVGAFRDESNVVSALPRFFVAGAALSITAAFYVLILSAISAIFLFWAIFPLYALYKVVFQLIWMYW